MININVNIEGEAATMRKLKNLAPALEDFHQVLDKIGDYLVHYYSNDVFKSWGGMYGSPWAPLADSTKAAKMRDKSTGRQSPNTPLIATGLMQNSFTKRAQRKELEVSNSAPYFPYHQSSAPRHLLPRRQMIGVDNKIKMFIKTAVTIDIHEKLGRL